VFPKVKIAFRESHLKSVEDIQNNLTVVLESMLGTYPKNISKFGRDDGMCA